MAKTILLIHGAWVTSACWHLFRERYEHRGFTTSAPPWPYLEGSVDELRSASHPSLPALTVPAIVDHYATIIRKMPEPPILLGHSFGGLVVQLLLDRGLGAAGIAVDPAPARGVLPGWNATRAALPVLTTWNGWNRALRMTFEHFAWSFAQTLPPAEQRLAYERHIVPAPGRIYFQSAIGVGNAEDYANARRAPLLLIAGEGDRTVEASMVETAFRRHQQSGAVTAFKTFPGRSHWLIASPGWEEIADEAIIWAKTNVLL